jgi:polyhydroxyalkanoate synthesis regulator phasin
MNKLTIVILSLVASSFLVGTAYAGNRDHRVNHRQHNQHARIAQGVKSGELNKDEAKDLHEDQKELRKKEKAYKADGQLTKDERKDLHKDLNENSKEIYDEKHDDETRH